MYISYFGLREKPFNITPDPRFLYTTPMYEEAYANLLYGIRERRGLVVLTGEVGTGKTTLLRRLIDTFDETIHFVFFYNTNLSFEEFLDFTCDELGLETTGAARLRKLQILNKFLISQLERGGTVALLVDEAQNLSEEVLESLRLLSNLETAREKLLQIVLVGQPELGVKLSQPTLRQLQQRITTRYRLDHLKDRDIEPFIKYRLHTAGYTGPNLFTQEATERIIVYTKGIPRVINLICDNALLVAYGLSRRIVSEDIIEEVAADLYLVPGNFTARPHQQPTVSLHPNGLWQTPNPVNPTPSLPKDEDWNSGTIRPAGETDPPSWSHRTRSPFLFALVVLFVFLLGSAGIVVSSPHIRNDIKSRLARLGPKAETLISSVSTRLVVLSRGLNIQFLTPSRQISTPELPPTIVPGKDEQQPLLSVMDQGREGHNPEPFFAQQLSPVGRRETLSLAPPAQEADLSHPDSQLQTEVASLDKNAVSFPYEPSLAETYAQETVADTDGFDSSSAVYNKYFIIPYGTSVSEIVTNKYGRYSILALDLIKEFNPRIKDLDLIVAGELLQLPPLTLQTLIRKQRDGTYRCIISTFLLISEAERFAQFVREKGYSVEIRQREITTSQLLYRVEITGLRTKEEATAAWRLIGDGKLLLTETKFPRSG